MAYFRSRAQSRYTKLSLSLHILSLGLRTKREEFLHSQILISTLTKSALEAAIAAIGKVRVREKSLQNEGTESEVVDAFWIDAICAKIRPASKNSDFREVVSHTSSAPSVVD